MSAASVGTYVLSLKERQGKGDIDIQDASARVLRLLGRKPCPFAELASLSGLPVAALQEVVDGLRSKELVEQAGDVIRLTPLGYKAHLIVAS
jgi:hypothetical protein